MQYSTSNSSNSSGSSSSTILYYEQKGLDGRTFYGPYMCNIGLVTVVTVVTVVIVVAVVLNIGYLIIKVNKQSALTIM